MAFSPEGRLLAHYAGYPLPFLNASGTGPEAFTAIHVGDTMTRPEGRRTGLGPTSLLARATFHYFARHFEGRVPFAFGFNTGRIRAFGARFMDYHYLEGVPFRTLDLAEHPLPRPILGQRFSAYRVERVKAVTAEWDVFLGRVAPAYGLLLKRDARYLQWRYLERPDMRYEVMAVWKGKRLSGWGVFRCEGEILRWGDALFDPEDPVAAEHLLRAAVEAVGAERIREVHAWASPHPQWWNDRLALLGFDKKEEPNKLAFCYKTFTSPELEDVLRNRLYYTWGDGDLY